MKHAFEEAEEERERFEKKHATEMENNETKRENVKWEREK